MRKLGIFLIVFGSVVIVSLGILRYQQHRAQQMPDIVGDNFRYLEYYDPEMATAGRKIKAAIAEYKVEHGTFPTSLDQLASLGGLTNVALAQFEYESLGGRAYILSVRRGALGVQFATKGDFRRIGMVVPDSPASKANLASDDYVSQIGGTDVTGFTYSQFMTALQGASGTVVTLGIRKQASNAIDTVTVTRGVTLITIAGPWETAEPNSAANAAPPRR
jgi:C-terminal processing protease CtpA/Prc